MCAFPFRAPDAVPSLFSEASPVLLYLPLLSLPRHGGRHAALPPRVLLSSLSSSSPNFPEESPALPAPAHSGCVFALSPEPRSHRSALVLSPPGPGSFLSRLRLRSLQCHDPFLLRTCLRAPRCFRARPSRPPAERLPGHTSLGKAAPLLTRSRGCNCLPYVTGDFPPCLPHCRSIFQPLMKPFLLECLGSASGDSCCSR